jgi:hypothetical protein
LATAPTNPVITNIYATKRDIEASVSVIILDMPTAKIRILHTREITDLVLLFIIINLQNSK